MYPFIRLALERRRVRSLPRLGPGEVHHNRLRCLPTDLDSFGELNNGRTLTLYDIGRVPLVDRLGARDVMGSRGWRFTVAGSSVRYRRRVVVFDRLDMANAVIGADARFFYMHQAMYRDGDATSSVLVRMAAVRATVAGGGGAIVTPGEFCAAMGWQDRDLSLPRWAAAWAEAEAERPWPPMLP